LKILDEVLAELDRAMRKFPTWPTDPLHALAVLSEEYGELAKEMLQLTYEPHKTSPEKVKAEAIQTAAMALRLLMSLDRYHYRPTLQHSQQDPPAMPRMCSEGDRFIGMSVEEVAAQIARES
jgi:NTP pyrophosphatase (non-canonical NTP hydrolase)